MFDLKTFLVKERIGFLRLVDTYDIYDPATGAQVGIAREKISATTKVLRFLIGKRLLPTTVEVREREEGRVLLTISRGVTLIRPRVTVTDGVGRCGAIFNNRRDALRFAGSCQVVASAFMVPGPIESSFGGPPMRNPQPMRESNDESAMTLTALQTPASNNDPHPRRSLPNEYRSSDADPRRR